MDNPTPQMADMRVFGWLGSDSRGVPYYLNPLNLVWSPAGADHDLEVFRRVATQLAADPAYWAEIIREPSWRHSLIGCVCLLTSGRREFFNDLCFRFRASSFIAPQIAVTLGLLHGSAARLFFESALDDSVIRRNSKQAVSAHRVLLCLGVQPLHDVSVESWQEFERDDAILADRVVREHWAFWSDRL